MKTFKQKFEQFLFSPANIPVFYGWIALACGIIGVLISVPGQTMGLSVFKEDLVNNYRVQDTTFTFSYMIGTIMSGLCITFAGKAYDRFGVRIMAPAAAIFVSVILIYLMNLSSIARFFEFTGIPGRILKTGLMIFGFFILRFFGQGVLTLTSRNMIMKWFDKRRGFANMFLGSFTTVGFSVSVYFFFSLREKYEWQQTMLYIALFIIMVFVPFSLLFFRDNPYDSGLKPDGNYKPKNLTKRPPSLPEKDYTLQEARKTYSYWIFTFSLLLYALFYTAFIMQIESVFGEAGIQADKTFTFFLPMSAVSVVANLTASWISDFIKMKYLLNVFCFSLIMAMAALILLDKHLYMYWVLVAGAGLNLGLFTVVSSVTWPRFFGLKHLGAITGYAMSFIVIGSAIGPFLFSLSKRFAGNYQPGLIICLILGILLFVLSFKADNMNIKKLVKTN